MINLYLYIKYLKMQKSIQTQGFIVTKSDSAQKQHKIFFKLIDMQNLQIVVVMSRQSSMFYTQVFSIGNLSENLRELFDNVRQLYDYLAGQKHQTLRFISESQEQNSMGNVSKCNRIQFQVLAHKILEKTLVLRALKTTQFEYSMAKSQIQEFEQIQATNKNILQKNKLIQSLKGQIIQVDMEIKQQGKQIKKLTKNIKSFCENKSEIQEQIKLIKVDYLNRNSCVVQKVKNQMEKGEQEQIKKQSQMVTASRIFDAVPNQCERHPLGKHIQCDKGKINLFLKNKKIKDEDFEGMTGFDWDSINILSLGGNKLTNKSLQTLSLCSEWPNVTQLYLFSNKITDITSIRFLHQLQILSLHSLQLNEQSCDFLVKKQFNSLQKIYLNFQEKVAQKCWVKIADSQFKNMPKLELLNIDKPELISSQIRVRINKLCQVNKIEMQLGAPGSQGCVIF